MKASKSNFDYLLNIYINSYKLLSQKENLKYSAVILALAVIPAIFLNLFARSKEVNTADANVLYVYLGVLVAFLITETISKIVLATLFSYRIKNLSLDFTKIYVHVLDSFLKVFAAIFIKYLVIIFVPATFGIFISEIFKHFVSNSTVFGMIFVFGVILYLTLILAVFEYVVMFQSKVSIKLAFEDSVALMKGKKTFAFLALAAFMLACSLFAALLELSGSWILSGVVSNLVTYSVLVIMNGFAFLIYYYGKNKVSHRDES